MNCKPSCIQKLNSIIKLNKFGIRRSSMKESSVTRIKVINYKVALNFFLFLSIFLQLTVAFIHFVSFPRCKSYDNTDYSLHVRQKVVEIFALEENKFSQIMFLVQLRIMKTVVIYHHCHPISRSHFSIFLIFRVFLFCFFLCFLL